GSYNISYTVHQGQSVDVDDPDGLLQYAVDFDFDPLSAVLVDYAGHGTMNIGGDGGFSYAPDAGFSGDDTFTYHVFDGALYGNIATVTINVTNTPPVANDDTAQTVSGVTVTVPVLANDTDADSDPLAVISATQGAHGLVYAGGSSVEYTPEANFVGTD